MIPNVKENILLFHKRIVQNPNHRYRSWEHCYSYFKNHRSFKDESEFDFALLHLAFYLASWGMYRGSSQLLQKDYLVHESVVQKIVAPKYSSLWDLDCDKITENSKEVALVFDLIEQIRTCYRDQNVSPTDTLVTKVLLGTMGCIPAYDRLFKIGIRVWNDFPEKDTIKFPAYFGLNSFNGLITFYKQHRVSFCEAKEKIDTQGIEYPIMKLVDMYFWNLGYQSE